MSSQKQIQDELRSLESGLPFNNSQPFSVPAGYFEGLPASILAKINAGESAVTSELQELSPLLISIPKEMPYSVPFSYFAENLENISSLSSEPEFTVLTSIGKTMPYTVPESYFDTLTGEVLNKIEKPRAKVIPLFARSWMRVAAAAVVGGALFLAGYQYFSREDQDISLANNTVDSVPTIVANNAEPIEKEIKKVSTKELEEFIANVQVPTVQTSHKEAVLSGKKDVKDLLKDVSDTEMETFLSTIPLGDEEVFITD